MPTYEVLIKAYCAVVVDADSEDEALELAENDVYAGDFDIDEKRVETLDTAEKIERAKRHADRVIENE